MRIAIVFCVVLFTLFISGCSYASKEQVTALENDLRDTRRVADGANLKAEEANRMAREALDTSRRTEEMLNRSFRSSMRK